MRRILVLAIPLFALLLSCGAPDETPSRRKSHGPLEIGGSYHVTGVTIGQTSGAQRPVQGRVRLVVEGDQYTTHFELDTVFPGSDSVAAEIVGTGEGTVDDSILRGSAELQVVAATVPGIDVDFAYVPRAVSSRVVSSSEAEFFPDGSVRIDISNEAAEGDEYESSTTKLVGYHVDDHGS